MRYFFISLLTSSLLMGFGDGIQTFSSDFEQHITDDQNKTLSYSGHMWSKRPDKALWYYKKPVEKKVYIHGRSVVIIEPDLEQAMMRHIEKDIDILAIMKGAKPLGDDRYKALFEDQEFLIITKDGVVNTITYQDMFDNRVVLEFKKQEQNTNIEDSIFRATIPESYDIIR